MSVILISGTIGAGKSSLTDMLAKEIDSKPFYENVEDNEVLPLFIQILSSTLFYCKSSF